MPSAMKHALDLSRDKPQLPTPVRRGGVAEAQKRRLSTVSIKNKVVACLLTETDFSALEREAKRRKVTIAALVGFYIERAVRSKPSERV